MILIQDIPESPYMALEPGGDIWIRDLFCGLGSHPFLQYHGYGYETQYLLIFTNYRDFPDVVFDQELHYGIDGCIFSCGNNVRDH